MRNILKGYHEIIVISVTLSAGTGGTATYTNLPGESYTLASLPIGTEIVLDNGDYLIYYDGLPRGEIEVTTSSGYIIDSMVVNRGGVQTTVSSTPIVLEDGDEISVAFIVINNLCFTANTAGSTIKLAKNGSPTVVTLETSTDGNTWSAYTFGDTITLANIGDKVYWRNTSETDTGFSTSTANYYKFEMTGSIAGGGDINFLLNKNSTTTLSAYCYYRIFYGCTGLTEAPVLPSTTLTNYCYNYMFYGCTGLTSAPELPATTLADICYAFMFQNCTGLTSAPVLPATTLASNCYNSMFYGCTGLTSAPVLPATTLAFNCYSSMFFGCTGLTTAPILPATTLGRGCYNNMFFGCTGLTAVPKLPATTLIKNCYHGMFYNCTSLTTIPKLSATALVDGCYGSMFRGCSKIKLSTTQTGEYQTAYRIPSSGTGTEDGLPLEYMFTNTGGTFKDTPTINTTYYTSNAVVS